VWCRPSRKWAVEWVDQCGRGRHMLPHEADSCVRSAAGDGREGPAAGADGRITSLRAATVPKVEGGLSGLSRRSQLRPAGGIRIALLCSSLPHWTIRAARRGRRHGRSGRSGRSGRRVCFQFACANTNKCAMQKKMPCHGEIPWGIAQPNYASTGFATRPSLPQPALSEAFVGLHCSDSQ
jgi:hypothetical protein